MICVQLSAECPCVFHPWVCLSFVHCVPLCCGLCGSVLCIVYLCVVLCIVPATVLCIVQCIAQCSSMLFTRVHCTTVWCCVPAGLYIRSIFLCAAAGYRAMCVCILEHRCVQLSFIELCLRAHCSYVL